MRLGVVFVLSFPDACHFDQKENSPIHRNSKPNRGIINMVRFVSLPNGCCLWAFSWRSFGADNWQLLTFMYLGMGYITPSWNHVRQPPETCMCPSTALVEMLAAGEVSSISSGHQIPQNIMILAISTAGWVIFCFLRFPGTLFAMRPFVQKGYRTSVLRTFSPHSLETLGLYEVYPYHNFVTSETEVIYYYPSINNTAV